MAKRDAKDKGGTPVDFNVAASTLIEEGHAVSLDASGYLIPAADTASTTPIGIAMETVDNTLGLDGALSALVRTGCVGWFDNDGTNPITQALLGVSAFVKTSASVCATAGTSNTIKIGTALKLDTTLGVLVAIPHGAKV
jgi:hypothetical protein